MAEVVWQSHSSSCISHSLEELLMFAIRKSSVKEALLSLPQLRGIALVLFVEVVQSITTEEDAHKDLI